MFHGVRNGTVSRRELPRLLYRLATQPTQRPSDIWRDPSERNFVVNDLNLDAVCEPSADIVAREIEGEIVIVPLVAGIGDVEDELYTLNESGQIIWQKLDGRRTLKEVVASIAGEFDVPLSECENDVLGFASELTRRRILIAKLEG